VGVVYLLTGVLVFQGLSGLAGGFGLWSNPTGKELGIPLALLEGTPFSDYVVPGAILLTVLGVGPLVAAFAVAQRLEWAWWSIMATGAGLVIWITVQISMIGYIGWTPLQAFYGLLGVFILGLALHPTSRRELLPETDIDS
jgi:hypothetical protein